MTKFTAVVKEWLTPLVVIVLLGVIVHDKYFKETPANVTQHDASVVLLGKNYASAVSKSIANPLNVVATGSFTTLSDLTQAQHDALDASLTTAWQPIAMALEAKFGKSEDAGNKASIDAIKAFYADLLYGAKGGK